MAGIEGIPEELLRSYYQNHFPAEELSKWLSQVKNPRLGDSHQFNSFPNREFSFTLKEDIYVRHKNFANPEELRSELVKITPQKIDIGGVWKKAFGPGSQSNEPFERELVFDVDMNDYDGLRDCGCTGANICHKCWKFMVVACKSLSIILTKSCGFRNILWVFSGRRGIHGWVSDSTARRLNNRKRSMLVKFIQSEPKPKTPFKQVYEEVLKQHFEEIILSDMDLFKHQSHREKLSSYIPTQDSTKFQVPELPSGDSHQAWSQFNVNLKEIYKNNPKKIEEVLMKVHFDYLFPKIDANVSTDMGHLLKAPFSVHPSTNYVCVPFTIEEVDHFNPFEAPQIKNLETMDLSHYINILRAITSELNSESRTERNILVRAQRETSTDY